MSALEPVTISTLGQTSSSSAPSSHQHGGEISNAPNSPLKGVHLTDRALKRIRVAMAKENISPDQGGLRLGVQGGGCSGLSYNIRFDTQPRERDRVYDYDGVRVFVDPKSFIYLNGMTLDYEETLMRQGFNFINPNSTKSCGCGSSFSG
jgi:iron-sulfur cluster assembly protein